MKKRQLMSPWKRRANKARKAQRQRRLTFWYNNGAQAFCCNLSKEEGIFTHNSHKINVYEEVCKTV